MSRGDGVHISRYKVETGASNQSHYAQIPDELCPTTAAHGREQGLGMQDHATAGAHRRRYALRANSWPASPGRPIPRPGLGPQTPSTSVLHRHGCQCRSRSHHLCICICICIHGWSSISCHGANTASSSHCLRPPPIHQQPILGIGFHGECTSRCRARRR